jgi:hypothetical protein
VLQGLVDTTSILTGRFYWESTSISKVRWARKKSGRFDFFCGIARLNPKGNGLELAHINHCHLVVERYGFTGD